MSQKFNPISLTQNEQKVLDVYGKTVHSNGHVDLDALARRSDLNRSSAFVHLKNALRKTAYNDAEGREIDLNGRSENSVSVFDSLNGHTGTTLNL